MTSFYGYADGSSPAAAGGPDTPGPPASLPAWRWDTETRRFAASNNAVDWTFLFTPATPQLGRLVRRIVAGYSHELDAAEPMRVRVYIGPAVNFVPYDPGTDAAAHALSNGQIVVMPVTGVDYFHAASTATVSHAGGEVDTICEYLTDQPWIVGPDDAMLIQISLVPKAEGVPVPRSIIARIEYVELPA